VASRGAGHDAGSEAAARLFLPPAVRRADRLRRGVAAVGAAWGTGACTNRLSRANPISATTSSSPVRDGSGANRRTRDRKASSENGLSRMASHPDARAADLRPGLGEKRRITGRSVPSGDDLISRQTSNP